MEEQVQSIQQMMMSEYDRKKKLADYVRFSCAKGWIIESQNDFNAVLFGGQKCNHTLHACITFIGGLFTCGDKTSEKWLLWNSNPHSTS
jgi:hypothetical protein